ncbi:hypothetical protein AGDE_11528 [Angomonas deanei]|uniref:RNA-editing substrate-binding complex 8 protein HEAT repeats domain-containing protein n=1 Tax=Angomonas deanei TaxID=59799 RepID=A0A7G2C570_9TRYP|nr:hypothetical protein AGDE_11528 [Angomonas deanei]CAD2213052.1 hypothetical protein, conserved [Angomonas deanei]|eukprot:EPY26125.1 hypothetical protein AGDE_11528 [Angomonas deanei]
MSTTTKPEATPAMEALTLVNALYTMYHTHQQEKNTPGGSQSLSLSDNAFIDQCVNSLETQSKYLEAHDLVRLVNVLKQLHYHSHNVTVWLTRRCTLIAAQLPVADLCQLFYNLHCIGCQDSLTAIVNQIIEHKNDLTEKDLGYIFRVLSQQKNTNNSSAKLLTVVQQKGLNYLRTVDHCSYHSRFLKCLTLYDKRTPSNVFQIIDSVSRRFLDTVGERDLLTFLSCADPDGVRGIDQNPKYAHIMHQFVNVLESKVMTMNIHLFGELLETLSILRVDTTGVMDKVLVRLDKDAGRLTIPHLVETLYLLSSYPPAQGHSCIVSLTYTAVFRAEGMNAKDIQSIAISLAHLKFFTDDFFELLVVLNKKKGGFRTVGDLVEFLELLDGTFYAEERSLPVVYESVIALSAVMNDEEVAAVRKILHHSGVKPTFLQQLFSAVKVEHRKTSSRKKSPDRFGEFL